MLYNFEERINRVINNHQFTCQHTSHYLFILKGFETILNSITLNVNEYSESLLNSQVNLWISYESAYILDNSQVNEIAENNYDVWVVDFNFFEGTHIAISQSISHETYTSIEDAFWVKYKDIENFTRYKTLSIFNELNPLIGVVDNPKETWTNTMRLELLKNSTIK